MVFVTTAPNVASCCRGETHGCNFPIWDREKRWKKAPMLWMSELSFGMSPAGMSPKCRWQRLNRVLQCVWRGSMALVCLVQKSIQNSLAKESQISGWVKLIRLPKSPKWMLQCKTDQFCGSHWYTVYTYFFHPQPDAFSVVQSVMCQRNPLRLGWKWQMRGWKAPGSHRNAESLLGHIVDRLLNH